MAKRKHRRTRNVEVVLPDESLPQVAPSGVSRETNGSSAPPRQLTWKEEIHEMMGRDVEVYDKEVVEESLIWGLMAQAKMLKRLAKQDFNDLSAGDTAHALTFVARSGGQLLRDASFAAGGPDSRSDMAIAAEIERIFSMLTPEQLAILRDAQKKTKETPD